jgi:hypothetical protein
LCFGLAARLKRRDVALEVVHEVARRCPLPINEDTSYEAQAWILHTQIAEELLAASRYPVVLCDRAVIDNYAYLAQANGAVPALDQLVDSWLVSYQRIVLVPVLDEPSADGTRAADPLFQRAIDMRVRSELERRGVSFVDLSQVAREHWLDHVENIAIDDLKPPQLDLL